MQITGNLGLRKPEGTDVVNIDDLNYNADILDQEVVKRIINSGGVPSIQAGADASKPAAGTVGRLYIATDTNKIYRDTGSAWQLIGSINWNDITGKPASFTPAAHKSTHATGGSDVLTPADIGAASASHTHTKSQITDFPTSLPANGGNADTVDNKHASDFAPAGYGLGGLGIRLAGGIDLNTIISNGWYDVYNPVNGVSGLTWHKLLVVASADGNYITQLAFSMTEGSDMYMRHRAAGAWGSWYRIAKATEIPTSLPANGGNADTVDGKHFTDIQNDAQSRVDTHAAQVANLSTLGHVKHSVLTATLDTTWSGTSAPYSKTVSVSGILSTDTPIIDVVMSGTYSTDTAIAEAWGYIYRAVTADGSITFYATEKPTVSLPIQIRVVR